VLSAIGKSNAYFVLVVGAQGVTAFRADADELQRPWFDELSQSKPSGADGRHDHFRALEQALLGPAKPQQQRLVWLGSADTEHLDLSGLLRYELRPAP
jgi:hypothetical protein